MSEICLNNLSQYNKLVAYITACVVCKKNDTPLCAISECSLPTLHTQTIYYTCQWDSNLMEFSTRHVLNMLSSTCWPKTSRLPALPYAIRNTLYRYQRTDISRGKAHSIYSTIYECMCVYFTLVNESGYQSFTERRNAAGYRYFR